mgnify:CR=1 FL=1
MKGKREETRKGGWVARREGGLARDRVRARAPPRYAPINDHVWEGFLALTPCSRHLEDRSKGLDTHVGEDSRDGAEDLEELARLDVLDQGVVIGREGSRDGDLPCRLAGDLWLSRSCTWCRRGNAGIGYGRRHGAVRLSERVSELIRAECLFSNPVSKKGLVLYCKALGKCKPLRSSYKSRGRT